MTFKDHFSAQSANYAKYRPHYPQELFDFLLQHVTEKKSAWDCATGNGQVAVALAPYFEKIIATDASKNQIANASPHPKVEYRVSTAENSGLPPHSFDLITVAQALHWFNLDAFYKEAKRVAKKGALIAIWGYSLQSVNAEIDKVLHYYYYDIIGKYWPPERKYIDEGYNSVPFPFEEIPAPGFEIKQSFTYKELTGYLRTWSATQQYLKANHTDPVDLIEKALQAAWGNAEEHLIRWPVFMKCGKV